MNIKELHETFPWLKGLSPMTLEIEETLWQKEKHYQGSWQKRGGPGAFMMLARKWDRIEAIVKENSNYDIFAALKKNDGDVIDDVKDLVGYLLLVLAKHHVEHKSNETLRAKKIASNNGYMGHGAYTEVDRTTTEHPAPFGYEAEPLPRHRPLKKSSES